MQLERGEELNQGERSAAQSQPKRFNRKERKDHKGERKEGDFEQIPMTGEAGHHAA
jgi:hypothetical protein